MMDQEKRTCWVECEWRGRIEVEVPDGIEPEDFVAGVDPSQALMDQLDLDACFPELANWELVK